MKVSKEWYLSKIVLPRPLSDVTESFDRRFEEDFVWFEDSQDTLAKFCIIVGITSVDFLSDLMPNILICIVWAYNAQE